MAPSTVIIQLMHSAANGAGPVKKKLSPEAGEEEAKAAPARPNTPKIKGRGKTKAKAAPTPSPKIKAKAKAQLAQKQITAVQRRRMAAAAAVLARRDAAAEEAKAEAKAAPATQPASLLTPRSEGRSFSRGAVNASFRSCGRIRRLRRVRSSGGREQFAPSLCSRRPSLRSRRLLQLRRLPPSRCSSEAKEPNGPGNVVPKPSTAPAAQLDGHDEDV